MPGKLLVQRRQLLVDLFFIGIFAVFAVILVLEWRYRLKSLRVGAITLAGAMLFFFQPSTHAAWRQAMSTLPSQRVTHAPSPFSDSVGPALSEYHSGIYTMYDAVVDQVDMYARERQLALAVLFWLACSPIFRPARGLDHDSRGSVHSAIGPPEA